MAHNYCECGGNKGSCIDCAEEEIDRLKAELEEARSEVERLKVIKGGADGKEGNMLNYPWHKTESDKREKPIPCINCGHPEIVLRHTHAYTYEACAKCNAMQDRY